MVRGERVFTYDLNGNIRMETDPRGLVTENWYDGLNRSIQRVIHVDSNPSMISDVDVLELFAYDKNGNLIESVLRRQLNIDVPGRFVDLTTSQIYDCFDRLVQSTDPENNVFIFEYDNRDNRVSETDARGNVTEFVYDQANRLLQKIQPSVIAFVPGTVVDPDLDHRPLSIYEYDRRGLLTKFTDPNGHSTEYEYDAAERPVRLVNPLGNEVVIEYDQTNNIRTISDFRGNNETYEYDRLLRRIKTTDRSDFTTCF